MSSTRVNSILLFFWGKWWNVILSTFSSYSLRKSLFSSAIWFCSSLSTNIENVKKLQMNYNKYFAILIKLMLHFLLLSSSILPNCSNWALYSATIPGSIFSLFGSRTLEWRKTVPKEQPKIFLMTSMKFANVLSSGQFWWLHAKVLIKFWPSLK